MAPRPVPLADNPEVLALLDLADYKGLRASPEMLDEALSRGWYSAGEVCQESGLTYRQLDYLKSAGVVTPIVLGSGQGYHDTYCESDVRLLRLVSYLTRTIGMSRQRLGKVLKGEWPEPLPPVGS